MHIKDGACEYILRMVQRERTLHLSYELDGPQSIPVTYTLSTIVGRLIDAMQAKLATRDRVAFFLNDVEMDAKKTMRDYNIPESTEGVHITVKTFCTLSPASSPELQAAEALA